MTETGTIIFDPLLPWIVLWAGIALAIVFVGVAIWRGMSGWWLRGLALATLLLAVANPSLQIEEREPLTDIVLLVVCVFGFVVVSKSSVHRYESNL